MLKAYLVFEDENKDPHTYEDMAYVFAHGKVQAKHVYKAKRGYKGKLQAVRYPIMDNLIKDIKPYLIPFKGEKNVR